MGRGVRLRDTTPTRVNVMSRLVMISGCSGGGKTTLLNELNRRGFATVDEPGRRIVAEEQAIGGNALPWKDAEAFARKALARSISDLALHPAPEGWVFFDRGLIDAASALASITNAPLAGYLKNQRRYHQKVFLTPPWPEIYVTDDQRKHKLADAKKEYTRLLKAYPEAGYEIEILERIDVRQRADGILQRLNEGTSET